MPELCPAERTIAAMLTTPPSSSPSLSSSAFAGASPSASPGNPSLPVQRAVAVQREPALGVPIKWTYAAGAVPNRPEAWREGDPRFGLDAAPPRMGEVLVARVREIGHHSRLDEPSGVKATILDGDVVGVVFSPRYATEQFEAVVPPTLELVQIVAGGGVCGVVVSRSGSMGEPTRLEPLGFLRGPDGARVNLADVGLRPVAAEYSELPVVLSVGASMDSGKTTSAAYLINGLTRGGWRVGAAKLTGTAAAKDPKLMADAGAIEVLDFARAGYASTVGLSAERLAHVADVCMSRLAQRGAEIMVLEIADGVMQRETQLMLSWFAGRAGPTAAIYSCGDAFAVGTGVDRLRRAGVRPLAVSGMVTSSPLSLDEARAETELPVLSRDELRQPDIHRRLGLAELATAGPVVVRSAAQAVGAAGA